MTTTNLIKKYNGLNGRTISKKQLQALAKEAKGVHDDIYKRLQVAIDKMSHHMDAVITITKPIEEESGLSGLEAPEYVFYNGEIYKKGYSKYFGTGYIKQTDALKNHPSGTYKGTVQVLKLLKSNRAMVAINVQPKQQIIDTVPYDKWLNKKTIKKETICREVWRGKKGRFVKQDEEIAGFLHGLEYIEDDSELDGVGLSGNQSVYDFITNLIIDRIKKGGLVWRKPWNASSFDGLLARNYVSKKRYKGINAFLLNFRESENPYFMTMKQVNDRNARVKEGASSWPVVYYQMLFKDKNGKQLTEEEADLLDDKDYYAIPMLKYYKVFNGADIEGIEWPKNNSKTIDFNDITTAKIIVDGMPQRPPIKHKGSRAYWTPDMVVMPPQKFFGKEAEYYSTLFHELVHSTGYFTRLNRDMTGRFGSKPYAYEELIAELGASFLCGDAGILYHTLDNSAAYIKSWQKTLIGVLEGDNKFIFKASADAQKAADFILDGKTYDIRPKEKKEEKKDREPVKNNRKPRLKKANAKVEQLKLALSGLSGFTRADQAPEQPKGELFTLPTAVGKWLGEQQRYRLVISMDGETHAGKSELAKKIANAMAEHGFTVAWLDLEQGGLESKDTRASFDRNVSKANMPRIFVGGGPATLADLEKLAQNDAIDVIAIDSATKIHTGSFTSTNAWMEELRVKYPHKIWLVIWQQNAQGGTRGGSSVNFDAPVHIKVYRPDHTDFKQNYAEFLKNRGNATDKTFRLHDNKILDIKEVSNV